MVIGKGVKTCEIGMIKGLFIIITTEKQFDELVEDNNLGISKSEYMCYKGCCFNIQTNKGPVHVICLNTNEVSTLVHEVVHLAHTIMSQKGIPISMKNTEIQAYLIERLYEESCKALKIKKTWRKKAQK